MPKSRTKNSPIPIIILYYTSETRLSNEIPKEQKNNIFTLRTVDACALFATQTGINCGHFVPCSQESGENLLTIVDKLWKTYNFYTKIVENFYLTNKNVNKMWITSPQMFVK